MGSHTDVELEALAERLRDQRPEAAAPQLARMKRRAIAQASAAGGAWMPRKGLFMKPRIAVVFVLALGLLMSGSGATLAVISDSGSASEVQYPDLTDPKDDNGTGEVLGQEESAPADEDDEEVPVQEERQVASSGGGQDLPFTGFLAIPLLVIGVMLLVAGGVMRSRTRPGSDGS